MKLIFIYGLPGVGKYTVAQELARQTGWKLFHNHMVLDLIISVFGNNVRPLTDLREKIWLDFFRQAVKENYKELIFTFVFDKYITKHFIQDMEALILPSGSIEYIALTCLDNALAERVTQRNTPNKIRSFEDLKRQIDDGSFYVPAINNAVIWIDTTSLSPAETANKIISHISQK